MEEKAQDDLLWKKKQKKNQHSTQVDEKFTKLKKKKEKEKKKALAGDGGIYSKNVIQQLAERHNFFKALSKLTPHCIGYWIVTFEKNRIVNDLAWV